MGRHERVSSRRGRFYKSLTILISAKRKSAIIDAFSSVARKTKQLHRRTLSQILSPNNVGEVVEYKTSVETLAPGVYSTRDAHPTSQSPCQVTPPELWVMIASYLDMTDLTILVRTSKFLLGTLRPFLYTKPLRLNLIRSRETLKRLSSERSVAQAITCFHLYHLYSPVATNDYVFKTFIEALGSLSSLRSFRFHAHMFESPNQGRELASVVNQRLSSLKGLWVDGWFRGDPNVAFELSHLVSLRWTDPVASKLQIRNVSFGTYKSDSPRFSIVGLCFVVIRHDSVTPCTSWIQLFGSEAGVNLGQTIP